MDDSQESPFTGQPKSSERRQGNTRRRGQVLEDALLDAAWQELQEIGYTRFTMESVAARAGTNKAVVYRRWENKTALVSMALQKHVLPMIPKDIPDTGTLRDDVYQFLFELSVPLRVVGAETLYGLMGDLLSKVLSARSQQTDRGDPEAGMRDMMTRILENAEKRGEADMKRLNPRVIMLPLDLFRFDILLRRKPIGEDEIREIVDEIFMPLVRRSVSES